MTSVNESDGVVVILIFYGDAVSLCRRAQLPRHPSDATPSFIKKGTAGKPPENCPTNFVGPPPSFYPAGRKDGECP